MATEYKEKQERLIRKWLGDRASYDFLLAHKALDSWMKYTVMEPDGRITEYYGDNQITNNTGQLLPVISIEASISDIDESKRTPGTRYLVGPESDGAYYIYEYILNGENNAVTEKKTLFDDRFGVRVKSDELRNYVLYNGELITYDRFDAGMY